MSLSGSDELDCQAVASKVAEVTLESDSLTETSCARKVRRRKKAKARPKQMEVDPSPKSLLGVPREMRRKHDEAGCSMEWEEDESDLGSTSSASTSRGDADDEQSDWVGYVPPCDDSEGVNMIDRRRRPVKPPSAMSAIQRKLERFSRDPNTAELSIDVRVKERTQTAQFARLLQLYKLEVVSRQRGSILLRKKRVHQGAPATS